MSDHFGTEGVVIPDLAEPITGYRAWTWDADSERLDGFRSTEWPADAPLDADHQVSGRGRGAYTAYFGNTSDVPCVECPSPTGKGHQGYGCGIYAYDSIAQMVTHASPNETCVWGTVQLWGKVYEHAHGYRAEHAKVTGLYRVPSGVLSRKAAEVYGVPLLDYPYSQAETEKMRAEGKKATTYATGGIVSSMGGTSAMQAALDDQIRRQIAAFTAASPTRTPRPIRPDLWLPTETTKGTAPDPTSPTRKGWFRRG